MFNRAGVPQAAPAPSLAPMCYASSLGRFLRMADLIEFETKRLFLRQWKPADHAPFALLNSDPRVMEFFPAPVTRAESDAMAHRCESLIHERGWGFWAAELKDSREFIGFVGLHSPSPNYHSLPAWKSVGGSPSSTGTGAWLRRPRRARFELALGRSVFRKSCRSPPWVIGGLAPLWKSSRCESQAPLRILIYARISLCDRGLLDHSGHTQHR